MLSLAELVNCGSNQMCYLRKRSVMPSIKLGATIATGWPVMIHVGDMYVCH